MTASPRTSAPLAVLAALVAIGSAALSAQSSSTGSWSAPFAMPLVAVHTALMPTGRVLMFDAWEIPGTPSARLWDPASNTYAAVPNGFAELFCSGHVLADDGRLITSGGHNGAGVGTTDATAFDPNSRLWTALPNLNYARWYPSMTQLTDGRFLTMGGAISRPDIAEIPELHLAGGASWVPLPGAQKNLGEYPLVFQAPNGRVFVAGTDQPSGFESWLLDVSSQAWTPLGTSPADGGGGVMYRPGKVMMTGGGVHGADPVSANTGVLDLTAAVPAWRATAPMAQGRFLHTLVILPDGKVLAVGGSTVVSLTSTTGVLAAELWDPDSETWTTLASMQTPRLYHSTALLLPDGRVLAAGGGRLSPAIDHPDGEIFSPPYLSAGPRPVVTAAPASTTYGSTFQVDTPDAASVSRVTLVRASSVTHALNYDQRFYEAAFTRTGGSVLVQAPTGPALAPAGYYMVFLLNAAGVPSVGRLVRVQGAPSGPALTVSDVNVVEGTGGARNASIAVTLTGAPSAAVSVDYLTVDGTATAGSDFTGATGRLTFAPGVTTLAVNVPIATDTAVEPNETFTLVLSNAVGATITRAVGTATIIDDDVSTTPTLYVDSVSVREGTGSGTPVAAFTVTLLPAAAQDVLVKFRTVPGTAVSPDDFASTAGTLTFAGGTTVQTIQVPIVPDALGEPDETFAVELSQATNAQVGTGIGVGTIVNDDTVTASFAVAAGADDVNEDGATLDTTAAAGWLGTGSSAAASYTGLRFTNVAIPPGATVLAARLEVQSSSTQWVGIGFEYGIDSVVDTAPFGSSTRPSQRALMAPRRTHTSDASWIAGTRYQLDDIAALVQAAIDRPGWASGKPLTVVLHGTGNAWARKFFAAFDSGAAAAPRLVVTYSGAGTANRAPAIASVVGTPAQGQAPLAVTFSASASDPDGQPLTYSWAYGDGATGSGLASQHTYTTPGQYAATVTVSDGALQAVSAPIVIQVAGATVPTLSIADASIVEGSGGTSTVALTVTLTGGSAGTTASVNYVTVNGTAVAPGDYTPASGTLTFSGGTTSRTILVDVLGDTAIEADETLTVSLSNATGASFAKAFATVTIANDDLPSLSVRDVSVAEGNAGTAMAAVTVTLSAPGARPVTVAYATAGATAQPPGDYTSTAGSLTFSGATTTQTILVPIAGDTVSEPDETFTVTLSSPAGATLARATGLVTIVNDDTGSGPFTATFQVASGADDVDQDGTTVTTDGSTVWIGSGASPAASYAGLRFTGVTLPAGAAISAAHLELNAAMTQWVAFGFQFAAEAATSSQPFTAASPPSGRTLLAPRIGHTSDASWVAGTWYPLDDIGLLVQAVVDQPGWQAGNALSLILQGTSSAWARKFAAAFEANPALAPRLVVTYSQAAQGPPVVRVGSASVVEGNAGTATATFPVTLSAASGQTVTVGYATADGTAVAGNDYTAASGTVTFAPGVTARTIAVPVLGDTLAEGDETFTVTLSGPVNAALGTATATGTITDDDAAPGLTINDVAALEGNAGTTPLTFTVTLSAGGAQPVTVNYTTGGGAASAGVDYAAASGTLTFTPGTTTQVVTVALIGDALSEPNETFVVTLSAASGAAIADATGIGTITDDDAPTLSIGNVTVTEPNTGATASATFTVTASAAAPQPITVQYTTVAGTATADVDYATATGTLTIPAGATSRTIPITVLGDVLDENNETFTVVLSAPVNATIVTAAGTGTISDNDAAPSLAIADVSVTEGAAGTTTQAVFTVTLSAASGRIITVNAVTANGSATTAAGDYTALPSTPITFAPGVVTRTVAVTVAGDDRDEADETFTVTLSGATNATIADKSGVATIVDDDPAPSITVADASLSEGNSGSRNMTFTATLSAVSGRAVSFMFTTGNGTATAGSDYTARTNVTVTIAAGASTATFTVSVLGDAVVEPDETFVVTVSGAVNGVLTRTQVTGTILADGT